MPPAQIITAPPQIISAQLPATGAVVYTALLLTLALLAYEHT